MIAQRSFFAALLLAGATTTAAANEAGQRDESPWRSTLQAGAIYQSESSLDSGGDVSVGRYEKTRFRLNDSGPAPDGGGSHGTPPSAHELLLPHRTTSAPR